MNSEQINQLVTIATRISEQKQSAVLAADAIKNIRFDVLDGFLTEGDIQRLILAEDILRDLAARSGQRVAIGHFNKANK